MKEAKIILTRIDMAAMLVALTALCLFFIGIAIMAVIDLMKLVVTYWSSHDERWPAVVLGLAVIWIAARWKQIGRE